MIVSTIPCFTI